MLSVTHTTTRRREYPRMVYPKPVNGFKQRPYMSTTWREFDAKPRLYISVDSESMAENFAFRFDRPVAEYRKLLPQILAALGLPADTKAAWSQKAGCSCGCSPGFILTIPVTQRRNQTRRVIQHLDFWATIGKSPEAQLAPAVNGDRIDMRADAIADILDGVDVTGTPAQRTGRSGSGNLRNFKAMSDAKFNDVAAAIRSENNDPEAIAAVDAEYDRRNF